MNELDERELTEKGRTELAFLKLESKLSKCETFDKVNNIGDTYEHTKVYALGQHYSPRETHIDVIIVVAYVEGKSTFMIIRDIYWLDNYPQAQVLVKLEELVEEVSDEMKELKGESK